MTYAIGEIIVYIVLAALIGLMAGYLLWYSRIVGTRTETNIMASVLRERSATLSLYETELAAALDERDHLRSQTEALTGNAERRANEVEALRSQVSQLRPLAHRVPELRSRVDEIDPLVSRVSELEDANAELNARAVAAEKALSLLTEQRDRLVSAVVAEDLDDADAENHPPFLEAEPLELLKEHPDDLQLINGIGPHLEGVLNENGIFTFQQIAQLTTEGVYELDGQLGFKGRIERDEWVRQAGTLHRLKADGGVDE